MKKRSSRAKQELRSMPSVAKKKLRSELPRRRRTRISPILLFLRTNFDAGVKNSGFSGFSVDSSSCSYFGDEVSCESSRISVGLERKPSKAVLRKRKFGEAERKEVEVEVSETSCVESNGTGAGHGVSGERSSKLKNKRRKVSEISKEIERKEDSKEVTASEISCLQQISVSGNVNNLSDSKENEVISCISAAESCLEAKVAEKTKVNKDVESRAKELEFCEVSRNLLDKEVSMISNSESTIEQRPEFSNGIDSDLACTENFSYDSHSDYSSNHGTAFSELQRENFLKNSDLDFSDYTPSLFLDSRSDFSERSEGDLTSSPTYTLLLQYRNEFWRSTSPQETENVSSVEEEYIDQSRFVRFEEEADEESYQMLRNREKRVVVLRDYVEDYSTTTDYGDLNLQQRLHMVHWIVQHCKETNLHQETMFLGVSLLDRFLSKGFFKSERVLQIVGIACIALATRIEENQPYNSVQRKNFIVGNNTYSRCEVVAMEWLVQEVLNFQCFLPTISNFLWFYLKAAKAEEEVEKRAKYLAVLLLSDQVQMYYMPSTVAAAVVILASLESSDESSIQNVIETHIRTKGDDLHECIESLEWLLKYV
ncbi:cyclin-SDS [Morus notabilis]|uniref:cyclin-SDS n=1 Tax=Morus notabilis TaxID=981085 RepID=UPI000CED6B63|nr:cyclin-SDS [Morus notabilis]